MVCKPELAMLERRDMLGSARHSGELLKFFE